MEYCTANLIGQWTPKKEATQQVVTRQTNLMRSAHAIRDETLEDLWTFSSENVENLEPLVSIGGFVSPKIQRRRSGGSPGIKVT